MEFKSYALMNTPDENGDYIEVECVVDVLSYSRGAKATYWEPPEYPEVEFKVYDEYDNDITNKITEESLERIEEHCWEWINEA
jgi:hypothetical protein